MATTKKKTTKSNTNRTSQSKTRKPAAKTGSKPVPRRADYRPRQILGCICFALAVFSAFGYFDIHAIAIDLLVNTIRGLVGFGYWAAPPLLLWASVILIFHGGMPVRLRTTAALTSPVLLGAFLHAILCPATTVVDGSMVRDLWDRGVEMRCGGVLGGLIANGLTLLFSVLGTVLILIVLGVVSVMILTRTTPTDLLRFAVRIRQAERERLTAMKEEEERLEDEEDEPPLEPAPLAPLPLRRQRKSQIDLFADEPEEELPREQWPEPVALPLKKKKERRGKRMDTENVPAPPAVEEPREGADPESLQSIFGKGERYQVQPPRAEPPVPLERTGERSTKKTPPPEPVPLEPEAIAAAQPEQKEKAPEQEQPQENVAQALDEQLARKVEYVHPPLDLLPPSAKSKEDARKEIAEVTERLDDTFEAFSIDAHVIGEIRGPTVTQYELELGRGVKLSKVTGMADDITVSLGVEKVRIAPIPGKSQVVGVEIPNRKATKVPIRDVLSSEAFQHHKSPVAFALGKDIAGRVVVGNIANLPHMLIAGTTGSGKSVCTNSIVISLLYRSSPDDVRLIMIDPKIVEFEGYNGIPHLLIPVVTDPKKAAGALQWAVTEMLKRYRIFAERHVRELESYNAQVRADPDTDEQPMPRIVVIIDELADLMLVASKEVEESICRLAQMGRAAGMHLIIATQRPSSDVITGLMKANIPSRVALTVSSGMESRIILDQQGAEKLLGYGDMLYNPVGAKRPTRVQGCFISDKEVADVIQFVKENSESNYDDDIMQEVEQNAENAGKSGKKGGSTLPTLPDSTFDDSAAPASVGPTPDDGDPMMNAAIDIVVETGMASVSSLQRKLKLGYSRAARLVDQMEELGVVGPFEGSKPRKVLLSKEQWHELKMQGGSLTDLDRAKVMSEEADREAMTAEDVDMPPFEVDG